MINVDGLCSGGGIEQELADEAWNHLGGRNLQLDFMHNVHGGGRAMP
jgi:hypothetical protein